MITARDLWAKLGRDDRGNIISWHSLVHHSADVAAVLLALLEQPTIAARLARLAGRDALDKVTRDRLGALAFLHDIGKANRGFRARVDPGVYVSAVAGPRGNAPFQCFVVLISAETHR